MKYTLITALVLTLFSAGTIDAQHVSSKVTETVITSAILKKDVKLMISLPENYEGNQKKYAVLYTVNGSQKSLEEIAATALKAHTEKGVSELIVVNIDTGDDDLARMPGDKTKYDQFLSAVEKEVVPDITKKYRTNGKKILYERSLSGSLALYAFLTKPALFNGYIAASKQWYETNNDYFNGLAKKALKNPGPFKTRKIFLATLNGAYNNNNIAEVNQQMEAFSAMLVSKSGKTVSAKYQAFDDWGITPQPGLYAGLLFVADKVKTTKPATASLTMKQNSDGKWVIQDSKKTILYEVFPYDNGPDYPADGLIRIVKNGKIGYADASNYQLIIEPQFDCAFPFENGKAKVSNQCKTVKDGEHFTWVSDVWKFIDKKGKILPE